MQTKICRMAQTKLQIGRWSQTIGLETLAYASLGIRIQMLIKSHLFQR